MENRSEKVIVIIVVVVADIVIFIHHSLYVIQFLILTPSCFLKL